jgi:hypothetical protein
MPLDLTKLEKVVNLAEGKVRARCPACAEAGCDQTGEHLCVYPDGRFGCCVHPQDRNHRKRIFALAGDKRPRPFTVKSPATQIKFQPGRSVTDCLIHFSRTPGTGIFKSNLDPTAEIDPRTPDTPVSESDIEREEPGTLGTPY